MNMQKIAGMAILAICVGIGIWMAVMRESGPDAISQEIAENLIFAQRDGVVYYENDNPQSWNAVIVWPEGETFHISYIDEEITDKGETHQWREMHYTFNLPDGGQVAVGDADMDGDVDSFSINSTVVFHTEPGYTDVNPELRPKAQKVLEMLRVAALALAHAPGGDLRNFVTPPGVPL